MELYLLRHGAAESRATSGRDIDRSLTREGEDRIRAVIAQARGLGVAPQLILASPYLRALQTARLAADGLGYSGEIVTSSSFTPDSAPVDLWDAVREFSDQSPILLVAHNPLLSTAASWMLGETRVIIEFRPGTLVRIDFEVVAHQPQGALRWTLHAN